MKKTLRSILAGAVALLAVSCYDDSDLRNKYGDLNDRVTAIESTLNAEVGGINDLLARVETLEGKVAAIKVETVDGVTTLTLSDESSVVLSKNGVLTVVDGGWATVAPDGTVTPLGVKVNHELDFKVENGELKYAPKGETNFTATGVKISTYTAHVIGNVVKAEDGKSVTVTIGDQTFELPLVSSAVATLGLSRDSFFLYHSGEKTVEITAEGLKDVYVMNQPDGWDATIADGILVIKAPKGELVEEGTADEDGLVLVHATTEEGKCIVAKIEVTTGLGLDLECDKDGNLIITNAFASLQTNRHTGEMEYGFTQFIVGIVDLEEYGDGSEFKEYLPYGNVPGYSAFMYNLGHAIEFKPYQEVVYEVDKIQITVPELYGILSYEELRYASTSIIWVVPCDDQGMPVADQLRTVKYTHILCQANISDITHNNAVLSCNLDGATTYYVGVVNGNYPNVTMETIFSEGELWMYLQNPEYLSMWSGKTLSAGEYKDETAINLADLNLGFYGEPEPLAFNNKYYVYVFPYIEGTVYSDFDTQFAPYVMEMNTLPLLPNGNASVTIGESSVSYSSIDVKLTPSENAESVYYSFYSVEEWSELEDKGTAAIFDALINDCYSPLTSADVVTASAESNETRILAAVAVDTDGKYGVIVSQSYTSLALPSVKDESLTANMSDVVATYNSVEVVVTPVEGTKVYWNYLSDASMSAYADEAKLVERMVSRELITKETVTRYTNMSQGSTMNLVLLIIGADNKYNIVTKPCVSKSYPYSETMKIECTKAEKTETAGTYKLTFNVSGASKIAVWSNYSGYKNNFESSVVTNAISGIAPSGYQYIDVVDGVAIATVSGLGNYKCLYATAYQVTDGVLVGLSKNPCEIASSNLPVVE